MSEDQCRPIYSQPLVHDGNRNNVLDMRDDRISLPTCNDSPGVYEVVTISRYFESSFDKNFSPKERLDNLLKSSPKIRSVSAGVKTYVDIEQKKWDETHRQP